MIGTEELRDALSRHLARVLTIQAGGTRESMAVDGVDQGVDLKAAAAVGLSYFEYISRSGEPWLAGDAASAAFAAGVIVGRTARESEAALTVPREEQS